MHYRFLMFDPVVVGLPADAAFTTVVRTAVAQWFVFIAPWILAAVLAGPLYGMLGAWWRRSKPLAAGLAVALPFIAEPALWTLRAGYRGPWFLWAVEVGVGLAVTVGVVRVGRGSFGPIGAAREPSR